MFGLYTSKMEFVWMTRPGESQELTGNPIQSPTWVAGTQPPETSLLPLRVCTSRKPELGAEPGLKTWYGTWASQLLHQMPIPQMEFLAGLSRKSYHFSALLCHSMFGFWILCKYHYKLLDFSSDFCLLYLLVMSVEEGDGRWRLNTSFLQQGWYIPGIH